MEDDDSKIGEVINLLSRITNGGKLTDAEQLLIDEYQPLSTKNRDKIIYHCLDKVSLSIAKMVDKNKTPKKELTRLWNFLSHAVDRRETTYSTTADYKDGISISFDYTVPLLQRGDEDDGET